MSARVSGGPVRVAAGEPAGRGRRPARGRHHRPDVGGAFAVALVCALASGFLLLSDILREQIRPAQLAAFAAEHPMALLLGYCVAVLAGLLAIGDVG